MKYSAVPQTDGRIIRWRLDGQWYFDQFPYLLVKCTQRIMVEVDSDNQVFCAELQESSGKLTWLLFTPDIPPIMHQNKGSHPEYCPKSQRIDGKIHTWEFDGDDPWVVCCWCGTRRRA